MYRTTLTIMHLYHPGHACMHRLLLAFDSAVHSCYVHVETVQSAWVFGHCAWVRVWSGGYKGQQPRADSSPPRIRARCQGSKGNVCGHTHVRTTHQHTMSSDLMGHLLWSGSVAASAQSSSKVSPRQPRCIIPFHLIPSTNCVQYDWPVSPGALRRRLRRCLLTLSVSYDSECVGGERVAH